MNKGRSRTTGGETVTSGTGEPRRPVSERQREVIEAWERFAAGEDAVRGVRPNILLSWYRCRDIYNVDPYLAAAPLGYGLSTCSVLQNMVFTRLGGAAGARADTADMSTTLISVTDAAGHILATWGSRDSLRHGADSTLAPAYDWAERTTGTNGMGTALERPGVALVQGAEHWGAAFRQWSCAGVAVRDPVTQAPLATLNVLSWADELPDDAATWVQRTVAGVEADLRDHAVRSGERIVEVFTLAEPDDHRLVLALDLAGKVVIANEAATRLPGVVGLVPAVQPHARVAPAIPGLAPLVERAVQRASDDLDWRGAAELTVPTQDAPIPVELHPIRLSRKVIGFLVIGYDRPQGEHVGDRPDGSAALPLPRRFPPRVAALRGSRIVLVSPQEIRYAEADGHAVWLITDHGRLCSAIRGLDNVARQLDSSTFLRVHRRFLVNVNRIKELEHGFKGALTLITSTREHDAVPVSRRHLPELRRVLGL